MKIPFHKPELGQEEIDSVTEILRSGWLTTGARTKAFESAFATFVGAKHAVALNSATAALHLALEALGLRRGDAVLVPTMTFAATAEVVRYFDAIPLLVDCVESSFNIDVAHARKVAAHAVREGQRLRAVIPVHYGGCAADMKGVAELAREFDLRIVEDAAHCCPAHYRETPDHPWLSVGAESDVCCYSFYANKCITTGEGGMACTNDDQLADRMRIMALHGISRDAWKRFSSDGSWYYEIIAPGFKYNLTDIASAIGIHQLRKAERFRSARESIALGYISRLASLETIILPSQPANRIHSWHLFPIRLKLDRLNIDRSQAIERFKQLGIGTSVHWMPLHMHPYYRTTYGYKETDLPVAARLYQEIISLPIYPGLSSDELDYICSAIREVVSG